jgi:hypothetical protein
MMVFVDVDRKMNDDVYDNVLFFVVVCYIHLMGMRVCMWLATKEGFSGVADDVSTCVTG